MRATDGPTRPGVPESPARRAPAARAGLGPPRRGWRPRAASRALVAALCTLAACARWRDVAAPAWDATLQRRPRAVRVRLADGRAVVVPKPRVAGDSLVGRQITPPPRPGARAVELPVAVAVADVRSLAVRRVDAGRTAAAVGIGAAAAFALYWIGVAALFASTSRS